MVQFRMPILGLVFGRLTVISCWRDKDSVSWANCKCECGNEKKVRTKSLKNGHTKSCGCLNSELSKNRSTIHGLAKHPLHRIWTSMLERCYNKNCEFYYNYGGRGVRVCDEWHEFLPFYNWAIQNGWGNRLQIDKDIIPKKLEIPALVYSPEMCCIVTAKENNRSRRDTRFIEYKGQIKPFVIWCEELNLPYNLTRQRIFRDKWSIDKAFEFKVA